MNAIKCPHCGHAAHVVSEKQFSQTAASYKFVCEGPRCGSSFSGQLELTRAMPSTAQKFTPGPAALTDC